MKQKAMEVISSPSQIVFLLMALTLCAGFLFFGKVSEENFIYLNGLVFAYYFGRSQSMKMPVAPPPVDPPTPEK